MSSKTITSARATIPPHSIQRSKNDIQLSNNAKNWRKRSTEMPIGGKLVLKGGEGLKGVTKKKRKPKRKSQQKPEEKSGDQATEDAKAGLKATAVSVQSGKTYEEEFSLEMKKAMEGKARSTPWGSGYRAPPKILHGYSKEVKGDTAEERLDTRAAMKTDKFCK